MSDPTQRASTPASPDGATRRLFVIANPAAAHGEVGARWDEVSTMLRGVVGAFEWRLTESAGHATELARHALQSGFDTIVAMGGDGTVNETVNGFFLDHQPIRPDATLGVLPCGTGGDFKRTLRLSGDLHEAALRLQQTTPRPCDVGFMRYTRHDGAQDERYFMNIASCGISGLVDKKVNQSSKALGGKLTFVLGTLRAWSEFDPPEVRVHIDQRIEVQVKVSVVVVANGRYFGGGMKMAPFARLDDGRFDVVIVRPMEVRDLVPSAWRLYEGRLFESPAVSHVQAQHVTIEPVQPDVEVLLDVDGEAPGRLPATFSILPGAIRILGMTK